jgi:hypothetical protein
MSRQWNTSVTKLLDFKKYFVFAERLAYPFKAHQLYSKEILHSDNREHSGALHGSQEYKLEFPYVLLTG